MHVTRNIPNKTVRAQVKRQRESHVQYFGLAEYGTWEKAEVAAHKWVKAKLAELPDTVPIKNRMTVRNTSGVVGVRLSNATRRMNGNEYPDWRWIAFWDGCPYVGGTGWSVNKYGDERAFVTAYLARKLESIDREKLDALCAKIKGSKEYSDILKLKRISPP
ncbi:MAG: hypothetical protein QX199_14995 [Methylococcaceae bacterium]